MAKQVSMLASLVQPLHVVLTASQAETMITPRSTKRGTAADAALLITEALSKPSSRKLEHSSSRCIAPTVRCKCNHTVAIWTTAVYLSINRRNIVAADALLMSLSSSPGNTPNSTPVTHKHTSSILDNMLYAGQSTGETSQQQMRY